MKDAARPVDAYIDTLKPEESEELKRIREVVESTAPGVEQGVSYAMPAFLYRGKALLSCMVKKKFLSIYPFSGKVIESLRSDLARFELTSGSIHFSLDRVLPEELLVKVILARMSEIDRRS